MAWLTGWTYRKSKIIDGSTAGIQTNYQMKLVVHKGAGTDTSTDIYLGAVRNDFGDVRFTKSDGSTLLNYLLDPSTLVSGISATFWIKVDSIPASPSSTKIYVYYDNALQTTTSTITAMEYFEDFSSNPTSSWTFTNLFNFPSYTLNGYMGINYDTAWNRGGYFRHNTLNLGKNLEYYIKMNFLYRDNIPTPYENIEWKIRYDTTGNNYYFLRMIHLSEIYLGRVDNGVEISLGYSNTYSFTYNHYYDVKIIFDGIRIKLYLDNVLQFDVPDDGKTHTGTMEMTVTRAAGLWDDIKVRKLVSPEPTFGITGIQETSTGTLNISSTPSGAKIFVDNIDQLITTPAIITGIATDAHTYKLTLLDYYDSTGPFTIIGGQTTTISAIMNILPCPVSPRYSGNTVTLKATPKDGIGPYYVVFRKGITDINPSRFGGLSNPILNAPENIEITRVYTLDDADIAGASGGTIGFSVYMTDSCPIGAQSCTQTCTINIGCVAPVCNFVVT